MKAEYRREERATTPIKPRPAPSQWGINIKGSILKADPKEAQTTTKALPRRALKKGVSKAAGTASSRARADSKPIVAVEICKWVSR
jgi:hypothetical protein